MSFLPVSLLQLVLASEQQYSSLSFLSSSSPYSSASTTSTLRLRFKSSTAAIASFPSLQLHLSLLPDYLNANSSSFSNALSSSTCLDDHAFIDEFVVQPRRAMMRIYATLASPASCLADWEALVLPSPIVPPKHAPSTQPSTSIATVADINAVLLLLAKAIQLEMTAMKALIRSELAVRRYDLKETGLHLCLARNSLKAWLALLSTPTTPAIVPHNQTNASTSSPLPSNTPPPPLPPPQQHQQQPDSSSNNKEKDTALLIDTIHRLYATIHRGSSRAGKNVETFKFLSLLSSSIGNKAATYFQQAYFSLNGGLGAASSFLRMGSLPPLLESNNTATMISKYVTQTRALNVSLIYMIQGDAPFWKNGYDCSMQRGVAYTRPTGLSSFPAIASFPGSPPLDHWPNIISIIQTHDRVALAPSHSGTTRGGDGGGEVGECDSMQGGDVNTTIATKGSNKNNSGGGSSRSVLSFTGSWRRQRKRTESEASFLESLFSGWGGVSSSMLPGVTATSSVLSESKQSPTVTLSSSNNNREVAATTSTTTTTSDVVETEVNVAVESNKSTSAAASTTAVALSVTSNVKPRPISASNKSLGSLSLISADECNDYTIDETPTGSSRLSSSSSHILSGSAVEAVNYNAGSTSSATPTIRRSTTTSITSISSNTNSKSVSVWTMVDAAPHSSTTTNTSAAAGLSETSRPRVKFYDRKVDATYALAGIDGRLVLVATHLGAWNSKNRGVDAENNASGGVDGGGDSTSPTTTSNDALFVELCVTVGKMLRHEIALSR